MNALFVAFRKDLLLQWRGRTQIVAIFAFGAAALLLFSFAIGPDGGGQHAQQRRLSRPVAARDHRQRAGGNLEADVGQGPAAAIAPAEPGRGDGDHPGMLLPLRAPSLNSWRPPHLSADRF